MAKSQFITPQPREAARAEEGASFASWMSLGEVLEIVDREGRGVDDEEGETY